ncbi:MAG TPA: MBL fold metallo-hydrolase [Candidatus Dormibacteraeota bacterium]|nr:MBL fold metallo-hydrolase [Candidatus Dormibacteraeota bacterium]
MERLAPELFRHRDTCNAYLLTRGREAVVIDPGAAGVLDHLAEAGVERVTDVLVTHHHRDQVQGLPRLAAHGARIWVPHAEQDLVAAAGEHWQARALDNSYNSRQDRFSALDSVPIAGTLVDYACATFAGRAFEVVPTPGHTTGSVTLLTEVAGARVALAGDLLHGPGRLWSLAATQWSYNGAEGVAATLLSLLDLSRRAPDLLLTAHGEPIADPAPAIDLLAARLRRLLAARREHVRLDELIERPYRELSPHLLMNRTSEAQSYVLLSESGAALMIDLGYDFAVGAPAGADRASRRPWLYSLPALRRQHGVGHVEVVLPTHYHDDHVAGIGLLRAVAGTRVWAAECLVEVLEHPERFDLPCLWYDPVPVDRTLPLGVPVRWREYELTLHALPGHTRPAVAVEVEVDGRRVLAAGDQWGSHDGLQLNYVYTGDFRHGDYDRAVELLWRVRPDLLLSGHWEPVAVDETYLHALGRRTADLEALHRELLPLDELDLEGGGAALALTPYRSRVAPGQRLRLAARVRNPLPRAAGLRVRLTLPAGWRATPAEAELVLPAGGSDVARFDVLTDGTAVRRARIGADLWAGGRPLGQLAEALVTVE